MLRLLLLLLLMVGCLLLGCAPRLVVGERADAGAAGFGGTAGLADAAGFGGTAGLADAAGSGGMAGSADAAGSGGAAGSAGAGGAQCPDTGLPVPGQTDPIAVPWATGFENGFCDYEQAGGFCVGAGERTIVTSPTVPGGEFSAEFTVVASDDDPQARCVRQGTLPQEAYYGAWYYVATQATLDDPTDSLWNLWHFRGGDASTKGLWDISLVNTNDGKLELIVFDFLAGVVRRQSRAQPITIPIGSWFHIQFYLKRAANATGAIRLYQDDQLLFQATGIVTDNSTWGQWYVGNLGKALTPAVSTLYVDDVTIDTQRR